MYHDAHVDAQLNLSQDGHLASGVPGTVAGIFAELKYAKLPMKTLIQPAIALAEEGFVITRAEANALNEFQGDFKKYNTVAPVFVREEPWKAGDTLIQKDLAQTLKLIRDLGAKGFYEGETARLIVDEMQRGNGLISYADLRNYTSKERPPAIFNYKSNWHCSYFVIYSWRICQIFNTQSNR
jgi:gamma-glutamyltranspeptidase/glutathione hydrolase